MKHCCKFSFALIVMILFHPLWAGTPSRFHEFAQVGDGSGFRTTILVMNNNTASVKVTLTFRANDGSPLEMTIDGKTNSVFDFDIPSGGSVRAATSGDSDPLKIGWAQLRAESDVGAQVLFEFSNAGKLITTAAVESMVGLRYANLFALQGGGVRTGLAIANLSDSAEVVINVALVESSGTETLSQEISLGAYEKTAQFLDEIFSGLGDFSGSVRVNSSGPIAVITLQQTGLVLGTLPVVEFY